MTEQEQEKVTKLIELILDYLIREITRRLHGESVLDEECFLDIVKAYCMLSLHFQAMGWVDSGAEANITSHAAHLKAWLS